MLSNNRLTPSLLVLKPPLLRNDESTTLSYLNGSIRKVNVKVTSLTKNLI